MPTQIRPRPCHACSVVATIHQPRSSIFALFNLLLVLSEGQLAYFGPAHEVRASGPAAGRWPACLLPSQDHLWRASLLCPVPAVLPATVVAHCAAPHSGCPHPPTQAVAWFASCGLPCPTHYNPADFFADVVATDRRSPEAEAASKERIALLVGRFRERREAQGGAQVRQPCTGGFEE